MNLDKQRKTKALTSRMIAVVGMLSALSVAFSFFESLLPAIPFMPPGAKLGLSNIVIMLTGWMLGVSYAALMAVVKALFAFATRGVTAGLMSLAGGLLSALATSFLLRQKKPIFGFVGIGMIGGICHNIGQLCVAMVMTSPMIAAYLPVLVIAGAIAGSITGITLYYIVRAFIRLRLKDRLLA